MICLCMSLIRLHTCILLLLYPFMCSVCGSVLTQPTPLNWAASILWYQSLAPLNTSCWAFGLFSHFPFHKWLCANAGNKSLVCFEIISVETITRSEITKPKGGRHYILFVAHSKTEHLNQFIMSFKIHYPRSTLTSVGFYCPEFIPCCQVHLASVYSDLLMLHRDRSLLPKWKLVGEEERVL